MKPRSPGRKALRLRRVHWTARNIVRLGFKEVIVELTEYGGTAQEYFDLSLWKGKPQ
jgi:hypothetical protein